MSGVWPVGGRPRFLRRLRRDGPLRGRGRWLGVRHL